LHTDDGYHIAHGSIGPEGIQEFLFRDQSSGALHQIAQYGKRFGSQGNGLGPSPETGIVHIKSKGTEDKTLLLLHFFFSSSE
jgi:hypothetical protein